MCRSMPLLKKLIDKAYWNSFLFYASREVLRTILDGDDDRYYFYD